MGAYGGDGGPKYTPEQAAKGRATQQKKRQGKNKQGKGKGKGKSKGLGVKKAAYDPNTDVF